MRANYISLTVAIDLFEQNRNKFVRDRLVITDQDEDAPSISNMIYIKDSNIEATTSLFSFIHDGKLDLYGTLDSPDGIYCQIPESITNNINWIEPLIHRDYIICNNYDYKESYNPSSNYDVLRRYADVENIYYSLSVIHEQLIELIESVHGGKKVKDEERIISLWEIRSN